MVIPLPLWPPATMRVLALQLDASGNDGQTAGILALARIDVVSNPALGTGLGRLMSSHYDPSRGPARPFASERLMSAVWHPSPPDILVGVRPGTRDAIPEAFRQGLRWISVLDAWRRMQPMVPSVMMEVCWERGDHGPMPVPTWGPPEREAWFAAQALHLLLQYAPLDELVALSRAAD